MFARRGQWHAAAVRDALQLAGREREFARIAQLLGEDTAGLTDAQAAERAVSAIEKLNSKIGIPARLRDLGATREQIPEFAAKALGIKRLVRVNPRVPTVSEMVELLERAY